MALSQWVDSALLVYQTKTRSDIRAPFFIQPDSTSREDLTAVSEPESLISASTIAALKAKVKTWASETEAGKHLSRSSLRDSSSDSRRALKICILDGFLLYSESISAIHQYMDIKYFLPVSYGTSKARREARGPYVLKDGSVWAEPPKYFDVIVWPNYVEDHGWMFEDGNVDGRVKKDIVKEKEIEVLSEGTEDMETILKSAVEFLIRDLTNLVTE
jgi:nicotinamide/nicotinate riboside kinase